MVKSRELGKLSFMGHSHPVRCVAASSDGKLLVSGGEDHKVRRAFGARCVPMSNGLALVGTRNVVMSLSCHESQVTR